MINISALILILFLAGFSAEVFLLTVSSRDALKGFFFAYAPATTKYHVLSYTITFWAGLGVMSEDPGAMLYAGAPNGQLFLCALLACTAAVCIAMRSKTLPAFSRPLVYAWQVWTICSVVYILFSQKGGVDGMFRDAYKFSAADSLGGCLNGFLLGMAGAFLAANLLPLTIYFQELTRPGFGVGCGKLFSSRLLDVSARPLSVALLLGAQAAALAVNHFLVLVPRLMLINFCFIAAPQLLSRFVKPYITEAEV